jgi:uncharacterized protein YecE (DUF72 family)
MIKQADSYKIGTAGWHYSHWSGPFYPENIKADEYLKYYAEHFNTVEINNSFYQIPDSETLIQWRETVPPGFVFSVKASRYITHMKKLKESAGAVDSFLNAMEVLDKKLGPILCQLPPNWRINPERLDAFIETLPRGFRYSFEFRDPSWFDSMIYKILKRHGVAFCIYDLNRQLSPKIITTDIVYIRLHGPDGPYKGQYKTEVLAGWAGALTGWARQGKQIYCYFDNDEAGYAPQDASRLKSMIED